MSNPTEASAVLLLIAYAYLGDALRGAYDRGGLWKLSFGVWFPIHAFLFFLREGQCSDQS